MTNENYKNKNILITGGLGFIGSSLAHRLIELGAKVTLADAMIPGYGGNLFNISSISDRVTVNYSDITDVNAVNYLVLNKDYIFHCAGQVCHVMSLSNPFPDIEYNIKGTAILMEACKKFNPKAKVIKTGTRGQYGPAAQLPIDENAPTNPLGIYEISNLTAEKIMKVYHDIHGVRSVMLRLTNIYGPRSQMQHSRFGVLNWFIRQAIDGETIKVFGDGKILRDFLFIDDCVEAVLMSGINRAAEGEIMNVGWDKPACFLEAAELIVKISQSGKWDFAEFSQERKLQEPGDFYSDIKKIKKLVGWEPKTSFKEGIQKTIDYYRINKNHYW